MIGGPGGEQILRTLRYRRGSVRPLKFATCYRATRVSKWSAGELFTLSGGSTLLLHITAVRAFQVSPCDSATPGYVM